MEFIVFSRIVQLVEAIRLTFPHEKERRDGKKGGKKPTKEDIANITDTQCIVQYKSGGYLNQVKFSVPPPRGPARGNVAVDTLGDATRT